jgi:cytidyltransferase-like protein
MENWSKKIHVTSSLPSKEGQYAMFIGRWQPLHPGHKEMFNQAINEGKKLLICIRDIEPNDKNPWTSQEVLVNVSKELKDLIEEGKVKIIIIPDISSVEFGRGVGYDIIEHIPPQEVADISATKIREQMKKEGKL